jgi:glutaconyl-CoA/methylmalonyl-CoA decarboxylase subunit gamma
MKSYTLIINGQKYNTKVKKSSPGLRIVEVNGVDYEVEIDGEKEALESRQKAINSAKEGEKTSIPTIGGGSKTTAVGSINDILSPIPGLVLDLKVNEGDSVSVGDLVMVMEAMKMENEIKSTKEGKVTKIHVNKGDSVLEGQSLMTIE